MSVGPITIFDKSALEGLNIDEAALFNQFYRVNVTPIFYAEMLADLEKELEGRTPEQIVGSIAAKTANQIARTNVHHQRLILGNLLGNSFTINGRLVVERGQGAEKGDQRGVVYGKSDEEQSVQRWRNHEFLQVEREFAQAWREGLRSQVLDRGDIRQLVGDGPRPDTL